LESSATHKDNPLTNNAYTYPQTHPPCVSASGSRSCTRRQLCIARQPNQNFSMIVIPAGRAVWSTLIA